MVGGAGFRRMVVLRPASEATLIPVANVHPNLLTPLSIDEHDGSVVAAYEFCPGATLQEIVDVYRSQSQLPPLGLAVRVVIEAARILHVAHEHQDALGGPGAFVHGALSDSSLLVGFDGGVRVLDFGLRKPNRFAAPEATRGGPFDARADIFSLAAALHSALTGFEKDYASTLAKAPSSATFPPPSTVHPDASQQLDAVLMRALMPQRESRLGSAAELADDLERLAGSALPRPEAVATRLRQLFEERLDGLRNMVPRLTSDAASRPARVSRPSLPAQPAEPAPAPRKSGPRSPIPQGTQPEVNPVGKRPTPSETKAPAQAQVNAAFGPLEDELGPEDSTQVMDVDKSLLLVARPTGEQPQVKAKKVPAPLPDVPWEAGPLAGEARTDSGIGSPDALADTGDEDNAASFDEPQEVEADLIEEVPTGLSKRASGLKAQAQAQAQGGGSTRAERARARGQELVQTGDLEPDEADDLRDQPTVVRMSGTHRKLDPNASAAEVAEALAGDLADEPPPDEPGTAIITSNERPNAAAAAPSPELADEPDTGVLEMNKKKAAAGAGPPVLLPVPEAPPKKKSGLRVVIAALLLLMAGGFGAVSIKNPALVRARLDATLIKLKLKQPPPPVEDAVVAEPETADAGVVVAEEPAAVPDAGDLAIAAPLKVLADAGEEDEASDGGEEEEEEGDGGYVDGGRHADGGEVIKKLKKKKAKAHRKEWWKTQ